MHKGKMQVAAGPSEDVEDVFTDEDPPIPAEERRRFWEFLHQFPGVTQKQKHVLIRRLVDDEQLGDIGKELGISAQGALDLYKRALNRAEKAWKSFK